MRQSGFIQAIPGIFVLLGLSAPVQADIFVYQLPGGARIVTDHPLSNNDYRIVRHSKTSKGAGTLMSSRRIASAVTDPTAYDRLIRRTAKANHVDAALVKAVMHVESGFNPHAVSEKGAQGLMQLMPETAQRYGAIDLFDPVQNVRAGVLYLKDLQKMFKNNTRLVLAAYNAGENAVVRHKGIPPYDETRDYVRKVIRQHREYVVLEKKVAGPAPVAAAPARKLLPAPVVDAVASTPEVVPVASVQPVADLPPEKNL